MNSTLTGNRSVTTGQLPPVNCQTDIRPLTLFFLQDNMTAQAQTLDSSIAQAVDRLYDMINSNPVLGAERAVFLTNKGKPLPEARQIGEDLHLLGKEDAMHKVVGVLMGLVENDMERRTDVRELDMCWNGIGEWKC